MATLSSVGTLAPSPWCSCQIRLSLPAAGRWVKSMSEEQRLRERVIQIEELLSHQEHVIQQLNAVVLQLRADYDNLTAKLQQRVDRLEGHVDNLSSPYDVDERPPHY